VSAPTTPILDDFNRADENPLSGGGNWAQVGAPCAVLGGGGPLALVSNEATRIGFIGCHSYWTTSFNADQESYARISAFVPTGETELSLYARMTDPGVANGSDGYAFHLQATTWRLTEFTNGVCTTLVSGPWPLSGGLLPLIHVDAAALNFTVGIYLWLRCEGTTIAGYTTDLLGSVQVFSVTDSAHNNAGNIGIRVRADAMAWDDFGGGNL